MSSKGLPPSVLFQEAGPAGRWSLRQLKIFENGLASEVGALQEELNEFVALLL